MTGGISNSSENLPDITGLGVTRTRNGWQWLDGTDFNYEDLEELDHEKYDVKLLAEEAVAGQPCFVIEARPLAGG